MKRQALGDGRWFDLDAATKYSEDTRWDGINNISVATGSQWDHEDMYHTASGAWILNRWSQMQGVLESWEILLNEEAACWLSRNGHVPDELKEQIATLEI